MKRASPTAGPAAGFTLVEALVSLALTLVITGAALTGFLNARRVSDIAAQTIELNDALRSASDLMVRDFIQVGQGLPSGHIIEKPSGAGAAAINRPGPPPAALTFPVADSVFPAVITGAGLGPAYVEPRADGALATGPATDLVTLLYVDSQFDGITCTLTPGGHTIPVSPNPAAGGADISGPGVTDPLVAGDLVLVTGSAAAPGSALAQITAVHGQSVHIDEGDSMNLNQKGASDGTIMQLFGSPATATPAVLSRVRMITYFIDTAVDPPRLMRQVNYRAPRAVAPGIDNLQLSYDLADGVTNPANVKSPAVPNQIRKVNLYLSARSRRRAATTGQFLRSSLATQVALRSLAFVDRYQ